MISTPTRLTRWVKLMEAHLLAELFSGLINLWAVMAIFKNILVIKVG